MRAWWLRQTARDRGVMLVGAAVVAVLLLWAFVWYPLAASRDVLAASAAQAEADLAQHSSNSSRSIKMPHS